MVLEPPIFDNKEKLSSIGTSSADSLFHGEPGTYVYIYTYISYQIWYRKYNL